MFRFSIFLFVVILISCNTAKNKPDVSSIKVSINVERFEKLFFSMDTNQVAASLKNVAAQSLFYKDFMQNILQVAPYDVSPSGETVGVVKNFLHSYQPVYDSVEKKYNNTNWLQSDLKEAFQYVKYYYPSYKVPQVVTFMAPLDAPGTVVTATYLGIGLQQYGGKNFSVYQSDAIQQLYPTYISRRFDKEYMVPNAMKAIADDVYPDKSTGRPLVEQMIEKGKQWYILDHFLPDAADSVKTGFSQKQLTWCVENEGNIWGYLIKNENPYAIEPSVIQTYIGEAPFTQGLPEASPGNIGQWIGWRIVQRYADMNPKLSLQQILQTPARSIFEGSKYKPK